MDTLDRVSCVVTTQSESDTLHLLFRTYCNVVTDYQPIDGPYLVHEVFIVKGKGRKLIFWLSRVVMLQNVKTFFERTC